MFRSARTLVGVVVEEAPFDVDGLGFGDLLFGGVKIALGHLFPGFVEKPDGVLLDVGSDGRVAGLTAGWVPGPNNPCGRRGCLYGGRGHRWGCLHGGRGDRRGCLHGGRGHRVIALGRLHGGRVIVGLQRSSLDLLRRCGRSSGDRGPDPGGFLEIRIEHGLFVLLKLIAVQLGSIERLWGELEIPAVKVGIQLEIPDWGTGAGLRAALLAKMASSGDAPSVAAPHAPIIKMTVSDLSLPNATSFRRDEVNRRHP